MRDLVDVYDRLVDELEGLDALAELLTCARTDELDARVVPAIGVLLKNIHAEMAAIVRTGLGRPQKKPTES